MGSRLLASVCRVNQEPAFQSQGRAVREHLVRVGVGHALGASALYLASATAAQRPWTTKYVRVIAAAARCRGVPRHWARSSPPKRTIDSRSAVVTKSSKTLFMSNTKAVAASAPLGASIEAAGGSAPQAGARARSAVQPRHGWKHYFARPGDHRDIVKHRPDLQQPPPCEAGRRESLSSAKVADLMIWFSMMSSV